MPDLFSLHYRPLPGPRVSGYPGNAQRLVHEREPCFAAGYRCGGGAQAAGAADHSGDGGVIVKDEDQRQLELIANMKYQDLRPADIDFLFIQIDTLTKAEEDEAKVMKDNNVLYDETFVDGWMRVLNERDELKDEIKRLRSPVENKKEHACQFSKTCEHVIKHCRTPYCFDDLRAEKYCPLRPDLCAKDGKKGDQEEK